MDKKTELQKDEDINLSLKFVKNINNCLDEVGQSPLNFLSTKILLLNNSIIYYTPSIINATLKLYYPVKLNVDSLLQIKSEDLYFSPMFIIINLLFQKKPISDIISKISLLMNVYDIIPINYLLPCTAEAQIKYILLYCYIFGANIWQLQFINEVYEINYKKNTITTNFMILKGGESKFDDTTCIYEKSDLNDFFKFDGLNGLDILALKYGTEFQNKTYKEMYNKVDEEFNKVLIEYSNDVLYEPFIQSLLIDIIKQSKIEDENKRFAIIKNYVITMSILLNVNLSISFIDQMMKLGKQFKNIKCILVQYRKEEQINLISKLYFTENSKTKSFITNLSEPQQFLANLTNNIYKYVLKQPIVNIYQSDKLKQLIEKFKKESIFKILDNNSNTKYEINYINSIIQFNKLFNFKIGK